MFPLNATKNQNTLKQPDVLFNTTITSSQDPCTLHGHNHGDTNHISLFVACSSTESERVRNSQLRYWHLWLTRSNQLISTLIKLVACGARISPGQAELLVATALRLEIEIPLIQTHLNHFLMGSFNLISQKRWKLAATWLNCLYFWTHHWRFCKITTKCYLSTVRTWE